MIQEKEDRIPAFEWKYHYFYRHANKISAETSCLGIGQLRENITIL